MKDKNQKTLRINITGKKFNKSQLVKLINDVNIESLKNKAIK